MELWDAYDKELKKLCDVSLIRGEPIPREMYHIVCEILVRHIDGTYLIMQRDKRKHLGGMWEATAVVLLYRESLRLNVQNENCLRKLE